MKEFASQPVDIGRGRSYHKTNACFESDMAIKIVIDVDPTRCDGFGNCRPPGRLRSSRFGITFREE